MNDDEIINEIEKRLVSSCNIVENNLFRDWFTSNLVASDNSFEKLFEPNTEHFQKIFGKHQFSFNIDKQYMVWRLLKGPNKLYCISHNGGTFYEIFYASSKKNFNEDIKVGETIISFIEFILLKLPPPDEEKIIN